MSIKRSKTFHQQTQSPEQFPFVKREMISENQMKTQFRSQLKRQGYMFAEKSLIINNRMIRQRLIVDKFVNILAQKQTQIRELQAVQEGIEKLREESDKYLEKNYGQTNSTERMARTLKLLHPKNKYARTIMNSNKDAIDSRLKLIKRKQDQSLITVDLGKSQIESSLLFPTQIRDTSRKEEQKVQPVNEQSDFMKLTQQRFSIKNDKAKKKEEFFDLKKKQNSSKGIDERELTKIKNWLIERQGQVIQKTPIKQSERIKTSSSIHLRPSYTINRSSRSISTQNYIDKQTQLTDRCHQLIEDNSNLHDDLKSYRIEHNQDFRKMISAITRFNQTVTREDMIAAIKNFPTIQ